MNETQRDQRSELEDQETAISHSPPSDLEHTNNIRLPAQPNSDIRSYTKAPTSEEILRRDEMNRAQGWAITTIVIPFCAIAFMPFVDAREDIRLLFVVGCLSYVATSLFVYFRIRTQASFPPALFQAWGYTSAIMTGVILYSLGLFSPAPLIVTLGISFFGLGSDTKHAILISVVAMLTFLSQSLLVFFNIIPDYGMFSYEGQSVQGMVFFIAMVPLIFMGALWIARVSRKSIVDAVERSVAAQQIIGQREALLDEVERELQHAINAGAGRSGRYTGKQAGEYELGVVIGRGGMGEVYEAVHRRSEKLAAVKLLREDLDVTDDVYQRFLREGQIGGRLNVPNIVNVFQVGKLANNTPFIIMERLTGNDLSTQLRKTRRLSFENAIELGQQVMTGIEAAHQASVIHRDIKPQNLFFHQPLPDLPGIWKILDFGVSKLDNANLTETQGAILGTPAYMAPEQARGDQVDHRIDLYSMGAVLYRALTGLAPFSGKTPLFAVVFKVPASPRILNPKLSKDMERFLALALSKSPDERFSSARDMLNALRAAADQNLSNALRVQADDLIHRFPWGTTLSGATPSQKM